MTEKTQSTQDIKDPIYLLGFTPLSCYLAAKFAQSGENPIILMPKEFYEGDKLEITLREEHSLKKQKANVRVAHLTEQKAQMLIITSPLSNLKSELMFLSPSHLTTAPVVIFTPIYDTKIVETLLKHNTITANFDGYLSIKENTVNIHGAEPQITLSKPFNTLEFSLKALSLFHGANILSQTSEDKNQIFWQKYALFALGSVFSAKYHQNLFTICKNKERAEEIKGAVSELTSLAEKDGVHLNPEEIFNKLRETPMNFMYETQISSNFSRKELNYIYTVLANIIYKQNIPCPILRKLLNKDISA